ncbi:calcium-binding protein (plasmid) [Streptomyces sp. BHT-5-2]|uniref:calcium-binding protein n=1 Tax=unclassified Streptomyces TaxID=2593676 RepID=UPI001C8D6413|nr:calcium-binding protein [Streptomyces sp. BHT-5-2]QZL08670.1 calcium-binding protein [Streptomyces sp. BHT-5-2]
MRKPTAAQLDAMVAEAIVDAYDEDEQLDAFHAVLEDRLALPFDTTVLGAPVTVTALQLRSGSGIVALCKRGRHRQAIGILDLPLPEPAPEGWAWVEAYRHWAP